MFAQGMVPAEMAAWAACLAFAVMLFNQMAKAKRTLFGDKEQTVLAPQPTRGKGGLRVCDRGRLPEQARPGRETDSTSCGWIGGRTPRRCMRR